jgi:hypothetical protein
MSLGDAPLDVSVIVLVVLEPPPDPPPVDGDVGLSLPPHAAARHATANAAAAQ